MTYRNGVARIAALTIGALALTSGVAGASSGPSTSPVAHGTVTAVGGVTTPGTCGVGTSGEFTVTSANGATPPVLTSVNVEVTPTTAFVNHKLSSPTFANLCVGDSATAIGSNTAGVVTASAIDFKAPHAAKPEHDGGKVTEVNGSLITGTCGVAGASGEFTINVTNGGTTVAKHVAVTKDTLFYEPKVSGATFADVCVGYFAEAVGPNPDGTVAAGLVTIHVPKPPKPLKVNGNVTAVNGSTASGACGQASTAGAFSVTYTDNNTVPPSLVTRTVNVSTATSFFDKAVAGATFANVCVGDKAVVIGNDTTGSIDALAVAVTAPKA